MWRLYYLLSAAYVFLVINAADQHNWVLVGIDMVASVLFALYATHLRIDARSKR